MTSMLSMAYGLVNNHQQFDWVTVHWLVKLPNPRREVVYSCSNTKSVEQIGLASVVAFCNRAFRNRNVVGEKSKGDRGGLSGLWS